MNPLRWMENCASKFVAAFTSSRIRRLGPRALTSALAVALLAPLAFAGPSLAQSMTTPPIFPAVDGNAIKAHIEWV